MKVFVVVYSREADEHVIARFKKAGIRAYTKLEEVRGEGTDTEPKLGTHAWPGGNNVLFLAVPDEEIHVVTCIVHQLKEERPRAGVRCFVLPLEEYI
ncbi:MAG: hypothetical protein CVU61_16415 [Deltaproteobacteria bacterium HGW-Deltaproteobacteria-19]|jgi:nitrogen regulatory protein PII|nr:MAG: hypothetical protein CVU61_16415 [Deltaproteobacteria bacterium HGW-Deltaproteobacteria-19]